MNILTSLLFLKKKTDEEMSTRRSEAIAGQQPDYPVFMAVAEKVGIDRRGNTVYKRRPDGEVILEITQETERIRVHGQERTSSVVHRSPRSSTTTCRR